MELETFSKGRKKPIYDDGEVAYYDTYLLSGKCWNVTIPPVDFKFSSNTYKYLGIDKISLIINRKFIRDDIYNKICKGNFSKDTINLTFNGQYTYIHIHNEIFDPNKTILSTIIDILRMLAGRNLFMIPKDYQSELSGKQYREDFNPKNQGEALQIILNNLKLSEIEIYSDIPFGIKKYINKSKCHQFQEFNTYYSNDSKKNRGKSIIKFYDRSLKLEQTRSPLGKFVTDKDRFRIEVTLRDFGNNIDFNTLDCTEVELLERLKTEVNQAINNYIIRREEFFTVLPDIHPLKTYMTIVSRQKYVCTKKERLVRKLDTEFCLGNYWKLMNYENAGTDTSLFLSDQISMEPMEPTKVNWLIRNLKKKRNTTKNPMIKWLRIILKFITLEFLKIKKFEIFEIRTG